MLNNKITKLTKINIEEYRQRCPQFYLIVKRISETEAFLLCVSPNKPSKFDLCNEDISQGMSPDSLEVIPALIPNLGFERTISLD